MPDETEGVLSNFVHAFCAAFMAPLSLKDVSYQKANEMSRNRSSSAQRRNRKRRRKDEKKRLETQRSRSGGEILEGESDWAVDYRRGGKIKVRIKNKKVSSLWDRYGNKKERNKKDRELKRKHKRMAFLFTTIGLD
jgi:hypothetical protein